MQLKREEGEWVWKEPKTRRSRRQIALAAPVVEVLRRHRERQEAERAALPSGWHDHDLVFCTKAGQPLFVRNLVRIFMGLLAKAAIPHMRFHDLRHTAATLLLSARIIPLLSCWERQAEGVDQGSERGEASLNAVGVREWHQREPGQEQTGADVGVEQQAEGVEGRLPPCPGVPGGMGVRRRGR